MKAAGFWLALALAACSKDAPGGADANPRDAVLAAWKAGGLAPTPFAPLTTPVGKDCASGAVDRVDVIVCVYASAAEAKAAEDAGLTWVGDTTGMAQARGAILVAAADRKKADPTGKTINALMKLAPK
ncbi:MAG: hypothetical protein NT062_22520 [Proteobacteria bacterium]|nr:hypothetical protein [Pseudomonadota bacterium]